MKIVKLIYDKWENEPTEYNEYGFNLQKSIPQKLGFEDVSYDGDYDMNRKLKIYSWGLKKNVSDIKVDIIFDLTVFQTKLDPSIDIPSINGLSNEIMISIINHPKFFQLLGTIVTMIETENASKVAFVCNHGKHRSVGWAELIGKYIYPKGLIRHKLLE